MSKAYVRLCLLAAALVDAGCDDGDTTPGDASAAADASTATDGARAAEDGAPADVASSVVDAPATEISDAGPDARAGDAAAHAPGGDARCAPETIPEGPPITPNGYAFGTIEVGRQSAPKAFSITNYGGATTGQLAVALANESSFKLTSDGCSGRRLAPAETCTVEVVFAPAMAVVHLQTTLVVSSSGCGEGTVSVSVTGTGVAP